MQKSFHHKLLLYKCMLLAVIGSCWLGKESPDQTQKESAVRISPIGAQRRAPSGRRSRRRWTSGGQGSQSDGFNSEGLLGTSSRAVLSSTKAVRLKNLSQNVGSLLGTVPSISNANLSDMCYLQTSSRSAKTISASTWNRRVRFPVWSHASEVLLHICSHAASCQQSWCISGATEDCIEIARHPWQIWGVASIILALLEYFFRKFLFLEPQMWFPSEITSGAPNLFFSFYLI